MLLVHARLPRDPLTELVRFKSKNCSSTLCYTVRPVVVHSHVRHRFQRFQHCDRVLPQDLLRIWPCYLGLAVTLLLGLMACEFRWVPYKADFRMGLNHQMSSLSCAMNEAAFLGRTLILPPAMCTDSKHQATHRLNGDSCIPFDSLFDVELISTFVSVRLGNSSEDGFTTMRHGCNSGCARTEYPCDQFPRLQRRQGGFWFSACLRQAVDTTALARRTEERLQMPTQYTTETAPSLAFLRSGLFYSRAIKAVARRIRRRIGGPYSSLHLRRSDKLSACRPAECRIRDTSTRAVPVLKFLQQWSPASSTIYIGSTEPASFFEPLAGTYSLLFASNFSQQLQAVRNNYAL